MMKRSTIIGTVLGLTLLLFLAVPAIAKGMEGDAAYTVWLVVFNNPAGCSDGVCDEDDAFEDPFPSEACFALLSGGRVQSNRRAAFAGTYAEGATVGNIGCFSDTGQVLEDTEVAEIHLVTRTHGGYLDGIAHEQISSYEGGCGPAPEFEGCADNQAAVFAPAGLGSQTVAVYNFRNGRETGWATLERRDDGIVASFHTRVPRK